MTNRNQPSKPGVPSSNLGGRTTFPRGFTCFGRDETGHNTHLRTRKVAVLVATALLVAASASAQDLGRYKLPVTLLAGAATVDISSTLMMAHYNQVHDPTFRSEKNPIVGWMEPRIGTPGMLAVGAAIEVTTMLVACKLLCEQHPKLMKWGLLTGAAVHGVTTTSNLRIHYGNAGR